TRSPWAVASRIMRLWWMSSYPETIATSAPPWVKLGGKHHPVPRYACSSGMAGLLDLRPPALGVGFLAVGFLAVELVAGLGIDLGERQVAQAFQHQVGLFDRQFHVQLSHRVLSPFQQPPVPKSRARSMRIISRPPSCP